MVRLPRGLYPEGRFRAVRLGDGKSSLGED